MSEKTKKCPFCREEIIADAIKCKHCGSTLSTPQTPPYDTLDMPLMGTPTAAGRVFSDRYRIVKELGRGGMGVVYLAHDEELDMDVALKFLPVELANNARALQQLQSEAKLSMSLSHDNIMRLHNLDTSGQFKFLVMEYVDGPDLLGLLREKERLPLEEALPIIRQVCDGLDYAHSKRMLHRDLKPANIMVTSSGEAKITDFGIARRMRESMSMISQKTISGTPAYMAPEHIMGEHLTTRSDIYSLGAVVYELLAGHPPFYQGDILAQIRFKESPPIPGIPETVNAAILKALAKKADDRPASATEFYHSLAAVPQGYLRPAAREEKLPLPLGERGSAAGAPSKVAAPPPSPKSPPLKGGEEKAAPAGLVKEPLPPSTAPTEQPKEVQERWQKLLKEADAAYEATSWRRAFRLYKQVPEEIMNERQKEQFAALSRKSFFAVPSSKTSLWFTVAFVLLVIIVMIAAFVAIFSQNHSMSPPEITEPADSHVKGKNEDPLQRLERLLYEHATDAEKALLDGHYDDAIKSAQEVLKHEPNNAEMYSIMGRAKIKKSDIDGAIKDLGRAIELDPKDVLAYSIRGSALEAKGDYEGAIQDYTKVIELDKTQEPLFLSAKYVNRGLARAKKDDLDGAIADYTKAIEIDPKYANAYVNRGNAKHRKGDVDGAISDYSRAIEINPTYSDAYYNRGFARSQKGDFDGAIADYTKAIKIDPKYAGAYYFRGGARLDKDNLDGAIADYDKAIEINPNLAVAYNNRGLARGKKGDLDGAIADYTKAIEIDPKHALAYNRRASARYLKGDLDGAIADYNKAIELNPKDAGAYNNLGIARGDKGDLDGAIADFNKAIEFDPNYAGAYYNRGLARHKKGDLGGAIADFTKTIEIDPTSADRVNAILSELYYNRGLARGSKGDLDGAIADYDKAIQFNPKDALAYVGRGLARKEKGDFASAIEDYEEFLRLAPDHALAKYAKQHIADLKKKLDK